MRPSEPASAGIVAAITPSRYSIERGAGRPSAETSGAAPTSKRVRRPDTGPSWSAAWTPGRAFGGRVRSSRRPSSRR